MFEKRKARRRQELESAVIAITYDVLKDVFNQTSYDYAKTRLSGYAAQYRPTRYISSDLGDAIIKVMANSSWYTTNQNVQRALLENAVDSKIEAAFKNRLLWRADGTDASR